MLYIRDEPSIGLHQRDNTRLIKALQDLRDLGNSVLVVEHDKEMMLSSDYILDVGPGPGLHGGHIIAQGAPKDFLMQESLTASGTGSSDLAPALGLLSGKTTTVPRLGIGAEYVEKHWGMRGRLLWAYTQRIKLNVADAQAIYPPLYANAYLQAVMATVGLFFIF